MQKRFNEYFAKVVLESCFPEKYDKLVVSDKPDIRHPISSIGIEVTYSMPAKEAEAVNLWHRIKNSLTDRPRDAERLMKLGIDSQAEEFVWDRGSYSADIINSPIKEFFDAVKQKVERLNSEKANYAEMEQYELFVNSTIFIPERQMFEVVEILKTINNERKRYSNIYLLTNDQKLLVFNMENASAQIKYLYNRLNIMAEKAYQICKEVD